MDIKNKIDFKIYCSVILSTDLSILFTEIMYGYSDNGMGDLFSLHNRSYINSTTHSDCTVTQYELQMTR